MDLSSLLLQALGQRVSIAKPFVGGAHHSGLVQAGDVFFALQDVRDGHDFVAHAAAQGAVLAVVERLVAVDIPQVVVPDVVAAMGKMASVWREAMGVPVIAITGSNGKTTSKNMLASILRAQWGESAVHVTRGNLNNHLGVPLTLFALRPHHRVAVIEMGMSHPGEIAYLSSLSKPQLAAITMVSAAHVEGLGSLKNVAQAKAEIFKGMACDSKVVLNQDDAFYTYWRECCAPLSVMSVGFAESAQVHATSLDLAAQSFTLQAKDVEVPLYCPLPGRHNISNALIACGLALSFGGVSLSAIQGGLAAVKATSGRLQTLQAMNGARILNDCYNANPASVAAAVDVLLQYDSRRILVFADMGELGAERVMYHRALGERLNHQELDGLFTVGELAAHTHQAYHGEKKHFANKEALSAYLHDFLMPQDTVLFKASRAMALETCMATICS